MAVNVRAKGARGEKIVKDLLIKHTGLEWVNTPASGALGYQHRMKGDLMVRGKNTKYLVEVKNYAESPISDKILTTMSNFEAWWEKACDQAYKTGKHPLIFFRYNRSKVFVATELKPTKVEKYLDIPWLFCYIVEAEIWLEREKIEWLQ